MCGLISEFITNNHDPEVEIDNTIIHLLHLLDCEERGEVAEQIMESYPDDSSLYRYCQAKLAFLGGRYQETLDHLEPLLHEEMDLFIPALALQAEVYFRLGRYQLAEQKVQEGILSGKLLPLFQWLQGSIYHDTGKFERSLEVIDQAQKTDNTMTRGKNLILMGDNFCHLGRYGHSLDLLHEAILIFHELNNPFQLAHAKFIRGITYFHKNDHELAIKTCAEALDIGENYPNLQNTARIKYTIGEIYYSLGDYRLAEKYLNEAQTIFEAYNNKRDLSYPPMIIGSIRSYQGRYPEAIEQIETSIRLLDEVGNIQDLSSCYQVMGEIYQSMHDFNEASLYYEKSLEIKRQIGNNILTARTLFRLIVVSSNLDEQGKIERYKQELDGIHKGSNLDYIKYINKITTAYILKSHGRLRDKVEAMQIFEEMVDHYDIDYILRIFVIINLCEILLDELKMVQREEIIDEILGYLDLIQTLAEHNQAYKLLVDILIIRSRLKLLTGRIDEAIDVITNVEKEHWVTENLRRLLRSEKKALLGQIDKLMQQVEQGADFYELIRESEITSYLREISKIMNFDR